MERVSVHEAKTHLSRLLRKIERGKEIIITKSGRPVAKLTRMPAAALKKRVSGDMKGQIVIPDDFDEPMPDEWFETDEYPQS